MSNNVSIPWVSVGPLIGIFALWFLGMAFYAIRSTFKGRYSNPRVTQMGGTRLLNSYTMEYGYWVMHNASRAFLKLGIGPNAITIISLILSIGSAIFLYMGWFGLGGWLMLGGAIFDAFDGMVAREMGVASEAGEFFDSMIDRYCEFFSFIGVMGYYFSFNPGLALIVAVAMVASIMITFARAKGEAQGIKNVPSGLMRRHERLLYIGGGTAAAPIISAWLEPGAAHPVFHLAIAAYALVGIIGNFVALRLARHIYRELRKQIPAVAQVSQNSRTSQTAMTLLAEEAEAIEQGELSCRESNWSPPSPAHEAKS